MNVFRNKERERNGAEGAERTEQEREAKKMRMAMSHDRKYRYTRVWSWCTIQDLIHAVSIES